MASILQGSQGRCRIAVALTAGFFAVYLFALPAHLVHHFFDEDQGRPTCPHLAQSQQTPELQTDLPVLVPPLQSEAFRVFLASASLLSPGLTGSYPRAPPRSAPSV